jgi:hypothetical protein
VHGPARGLRLCKTVAESHRLESLDLVNQLPKSFLEDKNKKCRGKPSKSFVAVVAHVPFAININNSMVKTIISVDPKKAPWEQETPLHNRWHPDIPPVASVKEGEKFREL